MAILWIKRHRARLLGSHKSVPFITRETLAVVCFSLKLIIAGHGVMNIKTSVSQTVAVAECRADYFRVCVKAAYKGCPGFQFFSIGFYIGDDGLFSFFGSQESEFYIEAGFFCSD